MTPLRMWSPIGISTVVVGLALVVVGCGDDGTVTTPAATATTASSAPVTVEEPTDTVWTPPPEDPTQPSPAAVEADRAFRIAPSEFLDCGVHVRTSGYPTTAPVAPDLLDCILDAAAAGTPAQFVTTARDFIGGMEGRIYRVVGPADVLLIDYAADVDGVIETAASTCTGLTVANFPIPDCG